MEFCRNSDYALVWTHSMFRISEQHGGEKERVRTRIKCFCFEVEVKLQKLKIYNNPTASTFLIFLGR